MTKWFDVTGLISFFRAHKNPTGIQRVTIEMIKAAQESGADVRLCYLKAGSFFETTWDTMHEPDERPGLAKRLVAYVVWRSGAPKRIMRRLIGARPVMKHPFGEGNVYVNFGAFWQKAALFAEMRRQCEVTIVSVVYDMIPAVRPEFCEVEVRKTFVDGLEPMLTYSDLVLYCSESTGSDLRRYSEKHGLPCPKIARFRLGDTHLTRNECP